MVGLCYVRFTGPRVRTADYKSAVTYKGSCSDFLVFRQICNLPDFQYRKNPAIPQSTINKIGFTLYRWEATKVAANNRMLMTI